MAMHNPPHPGEFIPATCIEPFDMSIGSLAENLGVAAATLARVVAQHGRKRRQFLVRNGLLAVAAKVRQATVVRNLSERLQLVKVDTD